MDIQKSIIVVFLFFIRRGLAISQATI
jgi:hypothetical protein